MKAPRMYYGALAVFCIIALFIGYASAADTTPATHSSTHGKGIMHQAPNLTNTTVQQQILDRLDKQGVDTSALRAAFQNGDTAAVKSWFEAYFASHSRAAQGRSAKASS